KKIRGKLYYLGVWADADFDRRRHERQQADLEAGRKPRDVDAAIDVAKVCNRFLGSIDSHIGIS
ncbi:MAG: hypothetical protein CMJ80_12840, partial [Planctomycetaceae bacterium]|nr:hypothetical protein [Planctomycetaceae bacterium]